MFGIGKMGARGKPPSSEAQQPSDLTLLAYHWRADDVSGNDGDAVTTWADRVGSVALEQGTSTYQPTIERSEINSQDAVYFADTNNHLEINNGTDVDYDIDEAFTGIAIVRADAAWNSQRYIMGKGDINDGWSLESGPTGERARVMVKLQDDVNANSIEVKTDSDYFGGVNVAHMVAFTYDGSNTAGGIKIYIDGAEVAVTTETASSVTTLTNTKEFQVGALSPSVALGIEGIIPEVCIYSRVLSAPEISQLYNNYFSTRYGV